MLTRTVQGELPACLLLNSAHPPAFPALWIRLDDFNDYLCCPITLRAMGAGKKTKHCLCSSCRNCSHTVKGESIPGLMIKLREWKRHAADDKLAEAQQDHLYYATFVASMSENSKESLPSRPRDLEEDRAPQAAGGTLPGPVRDVVCAQAAKPYGVEKLTGGRRRVRRPHPPLPPICIRRLRPTPTRPTPLRLSHPKMTQWMTRYVISTRPASKPMC